MSSPRLKTVFNVSFKKTAAIGLLFSYLIILSIAAIDLIGISHEYCDEHNNIRHVGQKHDHDAPPQDGDSDNHHRCFFTELFMGCSVHVSIEPIVLKPAQILNYRYPQYTTPDYQQNIYLYSFLRAPPLEIIFS